MTTVPTDRTFSRRRRDPTDITELFKPDHYHRERFQGILTPPCADQSLILSPNILKDPGFEKQLATYGTGPQLANDIPHSTIPGSSSLPFRWVDTSDGDSTNDPEAGRETFWLQSFTNLLDNRWQIATANPRTSTYHARKTMQDRAGSNGAGSDDGIIFAAQWVRCAVPSGGEDTDLYTAGVISGSIVTWSFYMEVNTTSASPDITLFMGFFDAGWNLISSVQPTFSLTTSYAQYSLQNTAPANAAYVYCYAWPDHDISVKTIVDMDDAVVSIA